MKKFGAMKGHTNRFDVHRQDLVTVKCHYCENWIFVRAGNTIKDLNEFDWHSLYEDGQFGRVVVCADCCQQNWEEEIAKQLAGVLFQKPEPKIVAGGCPEELRSEPRDDQERALQETMGIAKPEMKVLFVDEEISSKKEGIESDCVV